MLEYQVKSPILFLIFNRPDTTEEVFLKIKEVKPKELYIAADGPRINNFSDLELCSKARAIVEKIDWDCKVNKLYRDGNMGCKYNVSSAITWFFQNVEEGIILEDDCVPSISFFWFCDTLLKDYRNDSRINIISGSNFLNSTVRNKSTYYYSKFAYVWGWATWKRVWNKYDLELKNYNLDNDIEQIRSVISDPYMREFWVEIFKDLKLGKINTWDYQLCFLCFFEGTLNIVSNINLITNIGFRIDATHTSNPKDTIGNLKRFEIENNIHPKHMVCDYMSDLKVIKNQFNNFPTKLKIRLFMKALLVKMRKWLKLINQKIITRTVVLYF